jgi:hypothetical protein
MKKIEFVETEFEYYINSEGKIWDETNKKYLNPSYRGKFPSIKLYLKNKNRFEYSLPFLVYYHFGEKKVPIPKKGILTYWNFKDNNIRNCSIDNIYPLLPIENINLFFDYYSDVCKLWCNKINQPFHYLSPYDLTEVSSNVYEKVSEKFGVTINSGSSFISGTLKRVINNYNKENGSSYKPVIDSILKIKNVDKNLMDSYYLTILGQKCDSKVECFVLNILSEIGFINSEFEKKSLKEIIGVKLKINYIPDAYNLTDYNQKYVFEVFGFDQEGKDSFSINYEKKTSIKKELYQKYGLKLLFIHTHGKSYEKILKEMNQILLSNNLIEKRIEFNEKLIPQLCNVDIKKELLKLKNEIGFYDINFLSRNYPKLYRTLYNFLGKTEIRPIDWMLENIHPEAKNIISKNGWGLFLFKKEQKILQDLEKFRGKLVFCNDLCRLDRALYWRIFRFCKRNDTNIAEFLIENQFINNRYSTKQMTIKNK